MEAIRWHDESSEASASYLLGTWFFVDDPNGPLGLSPSAPARPAPSAKPMLLTPSYVAEGAASGTTSGGTAPVEGPPGSPNGIRIRVSTLRE